MRRLWLFSNYSNFGIGVAALSLTGYYIYNIYNEKKFEVPIIDQSIIQLNRNQELKRLAGSPLAYVGGGNSSVVLSEDGGFYVYSFSGPQAKLTAQLTGECKSYEEFLRSRQMKKYEDVLPKLEAEAAAAEKNILDIRARQQLLKPKSKEYAAVQQQLKDAQLKYKLASEELNQNVQERGKAVRKFVSQFYIPDKQHMTELEEKASLEEPIPANWKMWAITRLVADMPNGNKVFVIPNAQNQNEIEKKGQRNEWWTYKSLGKRLEENSADLNPEQLEAYSRHKAQLLYSKYGSYRSGTMFGGLLMLGVGIVYYLRNRMVPLNNSVFLNEIKVMFDRHPKIRRAGRYVWSPIVKGGRRGTDVNLEIDISGQIKGSLRVQARYDDKKDEYSISKAEFVGTDKQRTQTIVNLLMP